MMNGEEIRNLRKGLGWSQQRFSQELGVAWITISRWERGVSVPSRMAVRLLDDLAAHRGKTSTESRVARLLAGAGVQGDAVKIARDIQDILKEEDKS